MTVEINAQTAIKITPLILPVVSHVEIGNGQYHISNTLVGIGANGITFVKTQTTVGSTIPINHMGIIIIGFHAMQPNTTGSLILNIAGTKQARPSALNLLLFANMSIITSGNVQPIPPIHKYAEYTVGSVTRFSVS